MQYRVHPPARFIWNLTSVYYKLLDIAIAILLHNAILHSNESSIASWRQSGTLKLTTKMEMQIVIDRGNQSNNFYSFLEYIQLCELELHVQTKQERKWRAQCITIYGHRHLSQLSPYKETIDCMTLQWDDHQLISRGEPSKMRSPNKILGLEGDLKGHRRCLLVFETVHVQCKSAGY